MKDISEIFSKANIISPTMVEGMIEQGKPFIEKLIVELNTFMGDGEKVVIMTKANKDSEIVITVLDCKKSFELKGSDNGLSFKTVSEGGKYTAVIKRISVTRMVSDFLKGGIKSLLGKFL